MLCKSGKVPERSCVNAPQFAGRSPSAFLSSSLRQDHKVPSRPQVLRATSPHARPDSDYDHLSLCEFVVTSPPGLALPKDKTITISLIGGPSKGLIRRLDKPHISIGRSGGGADIEVDDQEVSDMHCAVGVKGNIIRLCDLDSPSGTYVENQRVTVAPLEHLSEFRVGSSVLLVTVLPTRAVSAAEEVDEFGKEEE